MKNHLVLNENNVKNYLKKQVLPHLNFKVKKIVLVKEITQYTNANYLFRIIVLTDFGQKSFILKQARFYNKRALKQGIKVRVDPRRIIGEVKMLKLLAQVWGQNFVPEIIHFDSKNYILIMNDVGSGRLLIEEFDHNRVHPELGPLLGKLFGQLHGQTFKTKKEVAGSISWKKRLINILPKNHWSLGLKKFLPKKVIAHFFSQVGKAPTSVIWMDPVYRNILLQKNKVVFFDFDHAMNYDPAFDNGVLLAQWVWMTLKGKEKVRQDSEKFIAGFIKAYKKAFLNGFRANRKELTEILRRTSRWVGLYLVSRTDGKSGSYFKEWPEWEKKIRQTGINLFAEKYQKSPAEKIVKLITS